MTQSPFLMQLELCSQIRWCPVLCPLHGLHPQELYFKAMERCQELGMTGNLVYSLQKDKKNVKSQWFQEHHDPAAATPRLWESHTALSNMNNHGLYQQTFIFPSNQTVPIALSSLLYNSHGLSGCMAVTCSVHVCILEICSLTL